MVKCLYSLQTVQDFLVESLNTNLNTYSVLSFVMNAILLVVASLYSYFSVCNHSSIILQIGQVLPVKLVDTTFVELCCR